MTLDEKHLALTDARHAKMKAARLARAAVWQNEIDLHEKEEKACVAYEKAQALSDASPNDDDLAAAAEDAFEAYERAVWAVANAS